jgi:hypothetical protein
MISAQNTTLRDMHEGIELAIAEAACSGYISAVSFLLCEVLRTPHSETRAKRGNTVTAKKYFHTGPSTVCRADI